MIKIMPSFECRGCNAVEALTQYFEKQRIPYEIIPENDEITYVDAYVELTKEQWKYIVNRIM